MYSIPVNITLENLNIGDTYNIKLNGQDVSSIYPTGLSFFAYKPSQNFSIIVNKEEDKLALINIVSTNNRTRIMDSSSIFIKCNHETICNIDLSDPGRPTFETVYPTRTPTETPTLTPTPTPTNATVVAYFKVSDGFNHNFVIKLIDQEKINQARSQINGTSQPLHITGLIIKESVCYNPNYSFYYDPSTIDFFEVAMEVCDATFTYTEEHLSEAGGAFLPGLRLCPWASYLISELDPNPCSTPTPTETPTLTPTPTNFENTPTPTPTPTNPANLFYARVCASTPPGWGSSGVLFGFMPRINKSYTIQGVTFNGMDGSLWWNDTPPEFDPPRTHILDSTPEVFPTTSNTRRLNFAFNPWSGGGLGSIVIGSEISAFSVSKNNNIVTYTVGSTITNCDSNPSLIGSNISLIYTVDVDSGNPQITEQAFCLTNYDNDNTQNGFLQNISITINSETLLLP
jgi:hypothetical protein